MYQVILRQMTVHLAKSTKVLQMTEISLLIDRPYSDDMGFEDLNVSATLDVM